MQVFWPEILKIDINSFRSVKQTFNNRDNPVLNINHQNNSQT